jgi:DNA-binding NtrC family response regulator
MRQMLEDWLRRDGFSVILASHSTEAFTVLINTRVDCVVADLKLDRRSGVHDGVDLLDRVALSYPHVGRIVFTAHPEEVPGKAFTAHVVVRKDGPPYELVIAIIAEIERRSSVAPQNPG